MLVPLSPAKSSGRTGEAAREAAAELLSWGNGGDEESVPRLLGGDTLPLHSVTQQGKPHRSEKGRRALPWCFTPLTPSLDGKTQVRGGRPGQSGHTCVVHRWKTVFPKGGGSWSSRRQRRQQEMVALRVNVWAGLESQPWRLLTEMQGKLYKISWPVKWGG